MPSFAWKTAQHGFALQSQADPALYHKPLYRIQQASLTSTKPFRSDDLDVPFVREFWQGSDASSQEHAREVEKEEAESSRDFQFEADMFPEGFDPRKRRSFDYWVLLSSLCRRSWGFFIA